MSEHIEKRLSNVEGDFNKLSDKLDSHIKENSMLLSDIKTELASINEGMRSSKKAYDKMDEHQKSINQLLTQQSLNCLKIQYLESEKKNITRLVWIIAGVLASMGTLTNDSVMKMIMP